MEWWWAREGRLELRILLLYFDVTCVFVRWSLYLWSHLTSWGQWVCPGGPGAVRSSGIRPFSVCVTISKSLKVLVSQSCPTPCDPMDWDLPGSFVYGILQARILKWVVIPFSRGSSQPRDQIWVSCIGRKILYPLSHLEVVWFKRFLRFSDSFLIFFLIKKIFFTAPHGMWDLISPTTDETCPLHLKAKP